MQINLSETIPGSEFFCWNEFLYCERWGVHVFPNYEQFRSILHFIVKVEEVRKYLNQPMIVTSGLRPVRYNRWWKPHGVGGAMYSFHMKGRALDFYCKKISADRIRQLLKPFLADFNLRMEDLPGANWVHIDDRTTLGDRFFKP